MTLKKHFLLSLAISINTIFCSEIVLSPSTGKFYSVKVSAFDEREDVERKIAEYSSLPLEVQQKLQGEAIAEIWNDAKAARDEASIQSGRDYFTELSGSERNDIAFIVNVLADTFEPKLWFFQDELKAAGSRIAQVHPLNFLQAIFGDDVLKVKVRLVKKKSIAWKNFISGVSTTMQEELERGNVTREMFDDFAKKVGVNPFFLYPFLKTHLWEQMVICLMNQLSYDDDYSY